MTGDKSEITHLLQAWSRGDEQALRDLIPIVESDLRSLARAQLRREAPEHTLQPTALVNEAYLRLINQRVSWTHRAHFFAIAARLMRQILVDHSRKKQAGKRFSNRTRITLNEEVTPIKTKDPVDLLALEEALEKLESLDPRLIEIVELRFYGGLTHSEVADVLKLSLRSVKREWALARAFLYGQLNNA